MISSNVFFFRNNIPKRVKVVAVTKNVQIPEIKIAKEYGIKCFGESRIQEALPKVKEIPDAEWHFIGHLQSNKVKKAVENFEVIQSVDRIKIAEKISKVAKKNNKVQKIMVQAKFGGKYGFEPKEIKKAVKEIKSMENLKLIGMMVIANKEKPENDFKKAKKIFDKIKLRHLSMGMTNDYKLAIKYGSNMIRIGRGIFK